MAATGAKGGGTAAVEEVEVVMGSLVLAVLGTADGGPTHRAGPVAVGGHRSRIGRMGAKGRGRGRGLSIAMVARPRRLVILVMVGSS